MILFLSTTVVLFVVAIQVNVAASIHEINVVNSLCPTGKDCITLEECLRNTTVCLASDTTINFVDKLYKIQGSLSDYNSFYIVNDVSHLTLAGNHSTISCSNTSMALAFINVINLKIHALRFVGCGGKMPESVQYQLHLTGSDNAAFFMDIGTWVALLFGNVNQLVLQQTEVFHSRGYGALIIDSVRVKILSSNFSRNNYQVLECYQDGIVNVSCCLKLPWHNYTGGNCNGGNIVVVNTERAIHAINTQTLILNTWITEGVNLDTQRHFNENYTHTAGGLSIFSDHSSYSEEILISRCTIARNIGHNGGNMVVYIHDNIGSDYHVSIKLSKFINGNAGFGPFETTAQAGGLLIKFGYVDEKHRASSSDRQVTKVVSIENSIFTGNYAFTAAAILFHSYIARDKKMQVIMLVNNCTISENFGYDTIFTVHGNSGNRFNDIDLQMTDVTLTNNRLLHHVSLIDPLLAFSHSPHISTFHGEGFKSTTCVRIAVKQNEMRGISTKQITDFRFQGVNNISGNRGVEGGGIYIERSRIRLQYDGARINLINNTATLTGGAIHVVPRILLNSSPPSCFFNVQSNQCNSISSTLQGSILLRNNSAGISGNSLYGGNIKICKLIECVGLKQTGTSIFKLLFDIPWNASLTEVTSDINGICFCINNNPVCDLQVWPVSTYPGSRVFVPAVAVGQLNGTNPGIVLSRIADSDLARLAEQEQRQQVGVTCQDIVYNIYSMENTRFEIGLSVITNGRLLETVQTVLVNTTHCPKGLKEYKCACIQFFSNHDITCFLDTKTFQIPSQVWVGYNAERSGFLGHRNCPFQKCGLKLSTFTLNSTSSLCEKGFSGILCGSCAENLSSTFGRITCRKCSSAFSILIVALFLFAGPLLIVVMLYGDLTVNRGTFNGIIFYANVVYIYRSFFFGPDHTSVVTVLIAWLNLDLGIDLCFYSGMTFYAQLWFQFLFPAYVLFLSALLTCLNWYTTLGGKIIGNNIQNVVGSLVLLTYTKLLRLVAEALSFTSLSSSSSASYTVWLYDGNIPYIKAKHAVMFAAAVVTLIVFIAPFTLLMLLEYPILHTKTQKLMVKLRLNTLTSIYQKPYRKSARWWTGMMLLVRIVVVILHQVNIVGNQKLSLILVLTIGLCILGTMWNLGSLYYNKFATISESLYITNLVLLAGWSEYVSSHRSQLILSYILVTPALLVFLITVLYHVISKVVVLVRKKSVKNRNSALQCQNQNQEHVDDLVYPDVNMAHCTYIRVSDDLKPLTEILNDN